jgi:hypothetical protein
VDGKFMGRHIRVVRELPDVFPEELPGTAPISKRPYIMSVKELK